MARVGVGKAWGSPAPVNTTAYNNASVIINLSNGK